MQTFAKLAAICNKHNRSTLYAEKIKDTLVTLLPTQGYTSWNSIFDAVSNCSSTVSIDSEYCNILLLKVLQYQVQLQYLLQ